MMTKFRKSLQGSAGFTLVELIVVIAVLGILAGIAIPRLTGVRDKADKASVKSDLRNVQSAMEMYFAEEGKYPTASDFSTLISENNLGQYISNMGNLTDYTTTESTVNVTEGGYTVSVDKSDFKVTISTGGISE